MTTTITLAHVPAGRINVRLLIEQLQAAGLNTAFELQQAPGIMDGVFEENNASALQAILNAHNPNALSSDQQDAADLAAQDDDLMIILPHLRALRALPAEDAAYALMGRAMAYKDGANGATISGIVDRATAAAYITSKPEWSNLTAATKAWTTDSLDMLAYVFQLVIVMNGA